MFFMKQSKIHFGETKVEAAFVFRWTRIECLI